MTELAKQSITFELEVEDVRLLPNPEDKTPIHGYTSTEAHDLWSVASRDLGLNVTVMLEVLSPYLYDIFGDPDEAPTLIARRARAMAAGRLERKR